MEFSSSETGLRPPVPLNLEIVEAIWVGMKTTGDTRGGHG